MSRRLRLGLTAAERETLEQMRDHHPKPYLRLRAAGLLKIAAGHSPHWVAQQGLLKSLDPDTVYGWLKGYRRGGIGALYIRAGRGRKPAFSPS
jgi:hypothetical protein